MPHYFYTYNISSDDFAVIETIRAEIYLFTMGTPYKINSRTLVLASSGEGFYHSNIPPRSHSDMDFYLLLHLNTHSRPRIDMRMSPESRQRSRR
jgi:hypothetical protein